MAKRRGRVVGWGTAAVGLLLLAFFNENAASFFEETGLNRGWELIEPAIRVLVAGIRFLGHPIMTHVYAFLLGAAACLGAVVWATHANQETPQADKLISLSEVVTYLREQTGWANSKGSVSDQDVQFELLDALSHGRLQAFARPWDGWGHPSALQRINPDYFDAVVIDMDAIRANETHQITLKPATYGDRFHHWTFRRSQVESIWPRHHPPRTKPKA